MAATILVIDNYDSFVYNIVQYVGKLGSRPLVYRNDEITLKEALKLDPDGVIISPGPGDPRDPRFFGVCSDVIREIGKYRPVLGVCLGHQGIVHVFGGEIGRAGRVMHGKTSLIEHIGEGVFEGVKNPFRATRYHSLVARKSLPEQLVVTAFSLDDQEVMGVRHRKYPIEGVQFHPESIMTEEGIKILKNFLRMCKR